MRAITLVLALVVAGCGELARHAERDEADAEMEKWEGVHTVEVLQRASPAEAGRVVFVRRACVTCHSVDGSRHTGPTLLGLYGSEVTLSTGETVVADADYIRRSILNPHSELVAGYRPEMSPYPNIRPGELSALVAYIRSLAEPEASTPESP